MGAIDQLHKSNEMQAQFLIWNWQNNPNDQVIQIIPSSKSGKLLSRFFLQKETERLAQL